MKKILAILFILGVYGFTFGQKVKFERISITDTIPPRILQIEEPTGFAFNLFTRNNIDLPKGSEFTYITGFNKNNLILDDNAYPEYIVEVEIINEQPDVFVYNVTDDKGNKRNDLYIVPKLYGELYLSNRKSGLLHQETVKLNHNIKGLPSKNESYRRQNAPKNNATNYYDYIYMKQGLTDSELQDYVGYRPDGTWAIKDKVLNSVNQSQIKKLQGNASEKIMPFFFTQTHSQVYDIFYIKKWKDNEQVQSEFNEVSNQLISDLKSNNYSNFKEYKDYFDNFILSVDSADKKEVWLYKGVLQNIGCIQFLSKNYEDAITTFSQVGYVYNTEQPKDLMKLAEHRLRFSNYSYTPSQVPDYLTFTQKFQNKNENKVDYLGSTEKIEDNYFNDLFTLNSIYLATSPEIIAHVSPNNLANYKRMVYNNIKDLKRNNKYFDNKEFYDEVKSMQKSMDDNPGTSKADIDHFFGNYPMDKINTLMATPDFERYAKAYYYTDKMPFFKSLIDTYAYLEILPYIDPAYKVSDYPSTIDTLIASLDKQYANLEFVYPYPSEIQIGLNKIKTQGDFYSLDEAERTNLLTIFKLYLVDRTNRLR